MIRMKTVYRGWVLMSVGILIPLLCAGDLLAQDTQWRGLNRDGKYLDTGLLKSWPEGGPELILQKEDLGNGYSTPIFLRKGCLLTNRSRHQPSLHQFPLKKLYHQGFEKSWLSYVLYTERHHAGSMLYLMFSTRDNPPLLQTRAISPTAFALRML